MPDKFPNYRERICRWLLKLFLKTICATYLRLFDAIVMKSKQKPISSSGCCNNNKCNDGEQTANALNRKTHKYVGSAASYRFVEFENINVLGVYVLFIANMHSTLHCTVQSVVCTIKLFMASGWCLFVVLHAQLSDCMRNCDDLRVWNEPTQHKKTK